MKISSWLSLLGHTLQQRKDDIRRTFPSKRLQTLNRTLIEAIRRRTHDLPKYTGSLNARQQAALEVAGILLIGAVIAILLLFSPGLYKAKRKMKLDIFKGIDTVPDEQIDQI